MDAKFMGMGIKNLIGCAIFTILFIIVFKIVMAKYPVKGVSELAHSI